MLCYQNHSQSSWWLWALYFNERNFLNKRYLMKYYSNSKPIFLKVSSYQTDGKYLIFFSTLFYHLIQLNLTHFDGDKQHACIKYHSFAVDDTVREKELKQDRLKECKYIQSNIRDILVYFIALRLTSGSLLKRIPYIHLNILKYQHWQDLL